MPFLRWSTAARSGGWPTTERSFYVPHRRGSRFLGGGAVTFMKRLAQPKKNVLAAGPAEVYYAPKGARCASWFNDDRYH